MDLRNLRIDGVSGRISDTGPEEDPTLLFIPGAFNAKLWKHQEKYFSKNHRCIIYEGMKGERTYQNQLKVYSKILETEDLGSVILVSHSGANLLSLELENHEDVVGTVMSGSIGLKPENKFLYNRLTQKLIKHPKLLKKFLLSSETRYQVSKEISDAVDFPTKEELNSFKESKRIRTPVKHNLMISHERKKYCLFKEQPDNLGSTRKLTISNSGYFIPFERPMEYNKAVSEFLNDMKEFLRKRNMREIKKKHKSLKKFENRLEL